MLLDVDDDDLRLLTRNLQLLTCNLQLKTCNVQLKKLKSYVT